MKTTVTAPEAAATRITSPVHTTRCESPGPSSWRGGGRSFHLRAPPARATSGSWHSSPIRKILIHLCEPLEPPPLSPASGPPTARGEIVQVHDDRDAIQATPDDLPAIDIYSLWPVPDASRRCPGNGDLGRGLHKREKNATQGSAGRFEKPTPDSQAALPAAHESLISRKNVAEVPLTGLSFARSRLLREISSRPRFPPTASRRRNRCRKGRGPGRRSA